MAENPIIIPSDEDIQANKYMAILSYFGIFLLIPMLARKDSEFCRFHVNQGILLLILNLVVTVLSRIVSLLGILSIVVLVFMILGIVNCVQGKVKPLPLIGNLQIYK